MFKLLKLAARKTLISGLRDVFAVVVSVRNRWVESKKEGKEILFKKTHTSTRTRPVVTALLVIPPILLFFQLKSGQWTLVFSLGPAFGNHGPEDSLRTCLAISERQRVPLFPAWSPHMGLSSHWGLKIAHEGFSIIQATLSGRGLIIKPECLPPL